jgi:hypothetical protein
MALNFEAYLKSIQSDLRRGNATEHTYRSALETLIESAGHGIDASNDPKHIECGAPDFIVERRKVPLGYIETKDVGTDLNKIEKTDQMKRYLKALHNLILTDYIEFRWYVNGERRPPIHLAARAGKDRLVLNPLGAQKLTELFEGFLATETPTVNTPKELAERLASVTHFIAEQIESALASGDASIRQPLEEQYTVFKDTLLPALKPGEFSDLYAQTVTYGLFAAKISAPEGDPFSLEDAYKYLRRIPFLRTLFLNVNEQLDEIEIIRPYLQDIVSLLNRTNIHEILADFGKRTRTEDPVVHFYETFLAKYDPKMRESRGVYYTPEPVVQFIVRSVDEILKSRFNKPWGLADDSVKVLDPAAGTGTFLYYVIHRVHDEIVNVRGQGGQWAQKSKQLLNRLFGFELLIPPYTISHLKLGLLMDELGAPLEGRDERVHVYLTNTLEEGVQREGMLPGLGHGIAKESSEAARVKQADDIMVVLGNPPYSNFGMMNKGIWITKLLDSYKMGLNEKKINLDDDYIKFIRYGQWKIDKAGKGIMALITNNSYLSGITHRIMRQSLLDSFQEIYILDLHGSSKKLEKTPKGEIDHNVFDIQQGVAIIILIKYGDQETKVNYSELWGTRESKYNFLSNNSVSTIDWKKLSTLEQKSFMGTYRFFTPHSNEYENEYCLGWSLEKIFGTFQNGLKTDRDNLFFDFEQRELRHRMTKFYSPEAYISPFKDEFRIENSSSYEIIRKRVETSFSDSNIRQCLYRPFDIRWIYYNRGLTSRPAWEVMKHLTWGVNLTLVCLRQTRRDEEGAVFVSTDLVNKDAVSLFDIGTVFPIYLYSEPIENSESLYSGIEPNRSPNITPSFVKEIITKLHLQFTSEGPGDLDNTVGPEDIFNYIYAILYCPTYRARYAEFLKIDFPRIPLTSDKALFTALARKGKQLVDLHLLKSPLVENFITTYPVSGGNVVEKVRYEDGKVWINPAQYFGGVPEAVWNFKVGGYQVCDKWLKDRKGRVLSSEDISHYQRVVVALHETIRLMKEIDETIPKWPIE